MRCRRPLGLFLFVVLLGLSAGCKATEQQSEPTASPDEEASVQPDYAAAASSIGTIQLYQGEDEQSLPVVVLGSGQSLTLEFDLLARQGRPLSIYFQHADRQWRRDLSPSQTLESFQDDRLLEYQSSRGTEVPYVHYEYRFPNDDIRFRLSGNYILRVTERGRRDSVLFEQPFFVAEEAGGLQLGAESVIVPGQSQPSLQPVARYTPPEGIRGDPSGHTVCFVRNGRLSDTRCKDRPLLVRQPELEFQLDRDRAYAPTTAGYELDLSSLRSTNEIARVDRTRSPYRVYLDSDYARFGENTFGSPTGQTVVRDALTGLIDPAVRAEYVETVFAFKPAGSRPYSQPLMVGGSFSNMNPGRGTTMEWNAAQGQYEGTVLLKQGRHQYFYSTSDPAFAEQIRGTQSRMRSTYTAFVYYRDLRHNTDRLLRVGGFDR